ncbi:hypothetical protein NHQ30_009217 [Ciborinia camelliae]|nr:hypothetical protein NHQ30_009217 [Ciborinia camelliae]
MAFFFGTLFLILLNCHYLLQGVIASQLITPNAAPSGLSAPCLSALTAEVPCSRLVSRFRYGYFYSESTLASSCTSECATALGAYENSVASACASDTWEGYDDEGGAPLGYIPSLLRYQYSLTCLKESGRWCNIVAGAAASFGDPGGEITENGGYELSVSPTPSPCSGSTYQIQPGDSCHSISTSQGISTAWLLTDNQLPAWCNEFPTTGALCLVNKCSVITVEANKTCSVIAKAANTTEVLLKAWNPILNAGCYNIDKMIGDQLCVSPPGDIYVDPTEVVLAPTTAITPAPVPTDIAQGTIERCGKFYQVQPDEFCNLLIVKFSISLEDFFFLNPNLYHNCTNLFAFESYCIQAVGDINTYSGRPGWRPTATSNLPFTSAIPEAPIVTAPPIVQLPTELPLAADTRTDCYRYFNGADFQDSAAIAGTSWLNQCQRVADLYGVSWTDFALWNTGLANITTSACAFDPNARYCGKQYVGEQPPESVGPGYEFPIREGAIDTCTEFADVPGDWECTDILAIYELTIAQFYAYNPAVGSDCVGLWPEMAYCIRAPGYTSPSSSSVPTSTSSLGPAGPTHTGQPASCNKWHVVVDGDSCASVAAKYGISTAQLFSWNPAVSTDCVTNFWLGQAYCVGISGTTTTPTSATTTTATSVPSPTQEGNAVTNCNKYAQAKDGDSCDIFAERNNVSLQQLYTWNLVLKSDGSGCAGSFWAIYWYCVGVRAETQVRPLTSGS